MKPFIFTIFILLCVTSFAQSSNTSNTDSQKYNFPNTYIEKGWDYYWKQDYENAIINYEKGLALLEINSKTSIFLAQYIECKMKIGDLKGAMTSVNEYISLFSTETTGFITRASIKFNLGDYLGVIKDVTTAIDLTKAYEKQEQAQGTPLNYKPVLSNYYNFRANAYIELQQYDNALREINLAIYNSPLDGYYHFRKGMLYFEMSKPTLACEELSKAGELGYFDAYEFIRANCN